ncbi:ubiquinol-cytochrome c reductase iron-sulfur subunit-like [Leguminivora glycinivorella]|uniref:ubiquinol-cytochrome c reductase iron-sulfur subunit-like n=1 Tax=Leguminivora glycinivorella TaxID=1035111 RepID=UPI00200CEF6B|nr:ubiquinol-cytochrome c reductase iron-sulfur subunit-like [Leguminivora glycinivorella]
MSFLSSVLTNSGNAIFRNALCCRDIIKTISVVSTEHFVSRDTFDKANQPDICKSKHCTKHPTPILTLWTQVRFAKECPKPPFHRDLEYPNFDYYRKSQFVDPRKTTWGSGDAKPGGTYVVGFFGLLFCAYGVKSHAAHYIHLMGAAADVLALASMEIDISKIAPGVCMSFKWRGKPVFVKNRTQAEIDLENATPLSSLRDPEPTEKRAIKQEWLVVIGICTHLGCVPIPNTGDYVGGFYCPCHGSHYDNAGRTRKGPAPLNLEVPPYKFLSDSLILVG